MRNLSFLKILFLIPHPANYIVIITSSTVFRRYIFADARCDDVIMTLLSRDRVYLDGDYREPPSHLMPPPPAVEEINDCTCLVM